MGISNTKELTMYPFSSNKPVEEQSFDRYMAIPDPTMMRDNFLFGIPLVSALTNQQLPDSTIQNFINIAISELEHTLGLYITPVEFTERQDYSRHQTIFSFGYLKLNHSNILKVSKFAFTFNNGNSIVGSISPLAEIPLEFIHVQPLEGTIQLVPAVGQSVQGFLMSIFSGYAFHALNAQGIQNWPGAIEITYTCGYNKDKVPALLSGLIGNMAALRLLSQMGPVIFPYSSIGVSIDGASQSVGTAGTQFLSNRIADLEKTVQLQTDAAKGYYNKKFITDFI